MRKHLSYLLLIYALAVYIRWWFITSEYQEDILERIEITTPLNSIKRVIEGKYRQSIGIDPYSSDVLHESPVLLKFYSILIDNIYEYFPYMFIIIDLITAHMLYLFAKRYTFLLFIDQEKNKHTYSPDVGDQILAGKDLYIPPIYVAVVYLFNPYTILNCVAMTTTSLGNLLLGVFLAGLIHNHLMVSIVTLSLATLQSFYPIVLLSPLYIRAYDRKKSHLFACFILLVFLLTTIGWLVLSKSLLGKWDFIEHTIGFILGVPDQKPNVGVFWYFFMEMFEHFRVLFIYSYQMNVTLLYFIPLSIKYYKDPTLLSASFITLIAIFKSYPSVGDFGLTLALLPCWRHLYYCMQQIFISCVTIVVTTALAPIFWDLWIFWGTANANFFFGATLAFITAHIFVVTDISFAYTKRDYLLKYGTCRMINGQQAKLVLD